jgi:hypothetical protein
MLYAVAYRSNLNDKIADVKFVTSTADIVLSYNCYNIAK